MTDRFIGTWRLISFERKSEDGQVSYPLGQDPVGYLVYSTDGYISGALMTANRPKWAVGTDMTTGTPEEKIASAETFFSYCGPYEVHENKVIHHVKACLIPNWLDTKQERFFEFEENRLTLSPPPQIIAGVRYTNRLVWERVQIKS